MKPNVFIVSQPDYIEPFADLMTVVSNPDWADILMFTGGADISPFLYGERTGSLTNTHFVRDKYESALFNMFPEKKKLGICRGAQFLCAMSGGRLAQHVTKHGRWHPICTFDKREKKYKNPLIISSTHHQMMIPGKIPHKLLAWAEGISTTYLNGDDEEISTLWKSRIEPEVVWFPGTRSLCIQGHPEIMDAYSTGVKFCRDMVKEFLL